MTVKMTPAMQKVDAHRDQMNAGRQKITAKDGSCVVYIYTNMLDQLCAIGYCGRAKKSTFNFRYSSVERRADYVGRWMKRISEVAQDKTRHKAAPRAFEVGDVAVASWGYEQTNIDYYLVTRLIGKTMVEVVKIGALSKETESMQGKCVPNPENIIGEPMRRKADGENITIDDVRRAHKKSYEVVAGARIYGADYWTSYY